MRTLIVISAALAGGAAFAQDSSFQNHLQSTVMVSPAQIYQIEDMKTDFSLGFRSAGSESKPEGVDATEGTVSGTEVFAAGIYSIKGIGLRAGLQLNYGTGSEDYKAPSSDPTATTGIEFTNDITSTVITPIAAYTVGPVVLGAALDVTQRTSKPEEGDSQSSTHNTFRPGVLYTDGPIEAGVAYASPNNITATEADELDVTEAAIVTLHGRYALDKSMAAGAIITNENWAAIDEDFLTDRQTLTGTFEMNAGDLKVEGDLGWKSKAWKKSEGVGSPSAETISTIGLGGAADYAVNKNTNVGGALGYEFGSESSDNVEVSANVLTVALRGNMVF